MAPALPGVFCFAGVRRNPCSPIDGCPRLRFCRAQAASLVEQFARATTPEARHQAQSLAAFTAHWLNQVDAPLFGALHGPSWRREVEQIAATLQRLAGTEPALHDVQFPDDGGRQLILDRLDAIEDQLRQVLHRREARHHHQAGNAGESEAA
jgi:hypothetical protein